MKEVKRKIKPFGYSKSTPITENDFVELLKRKGYCVVDRVVTGYNQRPSYGKVYFAKSYAFYLGKKKVRDERYCKEFYDDYQEFKSKPLKFDRPPII
jgi:hypothetical protein